MNAPRPFRERIRSALGDKNLQAALDANAERRISARRAAYASLPEPIEEMRRRAHQVRADTIANLDEHLETFTSQASAGGFVLHRAETGADVVRIVLEIAGAASARLVSKSKTMVGEEVHLNPALEQSGMRVIETDLGEFIVQLRREPPAHIITPAVHLRRREVGETFQAELGIPFTEDIPVLTAAARKVLRETFLHTDIGISGVNFGVAESGALCIITNEGNGRMVTTLPPVHIALMGIERIAPTWEDLCLLLALLPRSATGQKITVYANLLFGPRRPGEADGPEQRHLILVDNGRDRMRRSPLREALYCIRCGACLNACPVFREIGGHAYIGAQGQITPYPGPIGSIVSPGIYGQAEFGHLARATSLCGACHEACPVAIDLPKLLLRVRAGETTPDDGNAPAPGEDTGVKNKQERDNAPPLLRLGLRVYSWAAASPRRFAWLQRAASIFSRLVAPRSRWMRLPAATGWGFSRDFPRPASRSFRARWKELAADAPPVNTRTAEAALDAESAPNPNASLPAETEAHEPAHLEELSMAERFAAELLALGGTFVPCTEQDVAEKVAFFFEERGIDRTLAWEPEALPPGLAQALAQSGVRLVHAPDPSVRAGLTGALAAVAETGTIALPSGEGMPLTASLLPEVHVAVVREEDAYQTLSNFLCSPRAEHALALAEASSLVLVSGPSRTADIEMTLTIGVHGPGELVVFWVG